MSESSVRHWTIVGRKFFASFMVLLMTGAVTATATEPSYCVRSVDVVPAKESADLQRQFQSNGPLPRTPENLTRSPGARFPIADGHYIFKEPDGHDSYHRLYWSFSRSYELMGPREFANPAASMAVGGRVSLALGSTDETLPSGAHWRRQLLLRQGDDGAFTEVDDALQARIAEPHLIAWSNILNGFSVFSIEWRDGAKTDPMAHEVVFFGGPPRTGKEKFFVVRGDTAISLPDVAMYIEVVADLPSLGVTGLLGSGDLVLVNPQLEAMNVAHVDPGHGHAQALYDTSDPGWIYVANTSGHSSDRVQQYDYAVHVEQSDGKWRITDSVRIAMNDGRLGYARRWLFGEPRPDHAGDGVSRVFHAGWCRQFSTALRRMIFCEEMLELREGRLVPIAGGKVGLKEYLGDADSLGLAFFLGTDDRLYAYDGETLERIVDTTLDTLHFKDFPQVGRTVMTTLSSSLVPRAFEIRRVGGKIALQELTKPHHFRFDARDFYPALDGAALFAFARDGIYRLVGDTLTLIWPSTDYGGIETTGGMPPTQVTGWDGMLFITKADHGRGLPEFHLLRRCSAAAG